VEDGSLNPVADAVEAAVAARRTGELRKRAPHLLFGYAHLRSGAVHLHTALLEQGSRRANKLEGVDLDERRLEAAQLDPCEQRQLFQELVELVGGISNDLDIPVDRRLELVPPEGARESGHGCERRAQVVTGERHKLGEPLVVGHLLPCYGWRVEQRVTATPDLQASAPEVRIGLSRAGVTGVQKAVRMQHGGRDALVSAEIDCFVDLDPAQKGVHMSRFPELFEEAIDEVVIDGKLLVENLAEHIARHIVERQRALRAEVKIAARYPIERLTPVTGLRTQELVTLVGLAAASPHTARRVVGVEATGINACPCAQGLVREEAAERLGEAGFDTSDVQRILELVPLATHNQRGRGTLYLGTEVRLDAEDLVQIVETSMSSPIYELLKRPDELFVVEHAHLTPRFVEDSVRLMVKGALDAYQDLEDDDFVLARQVNFETIHNHDVLAERFGTVGELREELANGGHSARHTELRDWLRSADRVA
jgi:GTP cyclohydrolase IV